MDFRNRKSATSKSKADKSKADKSARKTDMKGITIEITLTDDTITLDGNNINELSEDDIIDSIKVLVSLAKTLGILWEGAKEDANA